MQTNILSAIRRELEQQTDANTKESCQSFFKEKIFAYGVKTAIVTKIAKKYFQDVQPLGDLSPVNNAIAS
jgi:3-methyladenine DNA glycosylase AlkD